MAWLAQSWALHARGSLNSLAVRGVLHFATLSVWLSVKAGGRM